LKHAGFPHFVEVINKPLPHLLYLRVEEMDGQIEVNIGGKVVMIAEGALI